MESRKFGEPRQATHRATFITTLYYEIPKIYINLPTLIFYMIVKVPNKVTSVAFKWDIVNSDINILKGSFDTFK